MRKSESLHMDDKEKYVFLDPEILSQKLKAPIKHYDEENDVGIYRIESKLIEGLSIVFLVYAYEREIFFNFKNHAQKSLFSASLSKIFDLEGINDQIVLKDEAFDVTILTIPYFSIIFTDRKPNLVFTKKPSYDATDMLELFSVLPQNTQTGSLFLLEGVLDKMTASVELGYKNRTAQIVLFSSQHQYVNLQINNIERYDVSVGKQQLRLIRDHDSFLIDLANNFSIEHEKAE